LNHNIYLIHAAKIIQQTLFDLFVQKGSFRGIKLAYVVDLFYKFFEFEPIKIKMKTKSETLTCVENGDILDFVEKYTVRDNHWRPRYVDQDRTLSIFIDDRNLCDIGENYISECALGYSNFGNEDVSYTVKKRSRSFDVFRDKRTYSVRSHPCEIIYKRGRQGRFACNGNVWGKGLVDIFEKRIWNSDSIGEISHDYQNG